MHNLAKKVKEKQTKMEQGLCKFESSSKKTEDSS
jgi:hypothetical protein